MRRLFPVAVVLCAAIGAANLAHAQSALKELEEKIRRQVQPQQPGQAPPPIIAEGTGMAPPEPLPASKAEAGSGYLGLVADDREDGQPGVRILEVAPGGPADRAGLRPGDMITGLGGVKIRQLSEMAAIVQHVPPDGGIEFEIVRGDRPQTLRVVFGRRSRPGQAELPPMEPPAPARDRPAKDVDSRLERLERRIEQLEQRILSLERRVAQIRGGG